jgi:DnaJ-class molecular chaperone
MPGESADDWTVCPRCDGDGYEDEYEEDVCLTCLGEGEVLLDTPQPPGVL